MVKKVVLLWILFCNFASIISALYSITAKGNKIHELMRCHAKKNYFEKTFRAYQKLFAAFKRLFFSLCLVNSSTIVSSLRFGLGRW